LFYKTQNAQNHSSKHLMVQRSPQLVVQSNTFNGEKRIQLLIEIVVIWVLF